MKLIFVGDLNFGEYYTTFGHGPKTRLRTQDILKNVEFIFRDADVVAGNLEAPISSESCQVSRPEREVLRVDPAIAGYLKKWNFRVLQVANNHIVQHGSSGFSETIEMLAEAGICTVGKVDDNLKILSIDGLRIGFMAASDVPDNTDKNQESYVRLDEAFIESVESNVAQVDHMFVMLHWGLEASTTPMAYQYELMGRLKAMGVRGIIGSHPHLFYEIRVVDDCVYAPSLGNFVFDLCWDKRLLKTGILEVNIQGKKVSAHVWPVELTQDGCVPVVTKSAQTVDGNLRLYDLGKNMNFQQVRKLIYFVKNILRGDTLLKLQFIANKIKKRLTGILDT